jgi:hypothetical protein
MTRGRDSALTKEEASTPANSAEIEAFTGNRQFNLTPSRDGAKNARSRSSNLFARAGYVLIDEDLVAVWIEQHKARRPRRRLVGPTRQFNTSARERSLDVTHVVEVGQCCARAIPSGVERQDVFVKHALEQPDCTRLVLEDRKVAAIAAYDTKAELLVELT